MEAERSGPGPVQDHTSTGVMEPYFPACLQGASGRVDHGSCASVGWLLKSGALLPWIPYFPDVATPF